MIRGFFAVVLWLALGTVALGVAEGSFLVSRVAVEGLERTDEEVVRRELPFAEGERATLADVEEGVRRLKNMQIFRTVAYELRDEAGARVLTLRLTEKWTTIPIAKFSGGGGKNRITLGAFDVNLGGRYLEAGAQYERLQFENSGVAWFRDPRFLGSRTELFVSLWNITRDDTLYEEYGKTNRVDGRLLNSRERIATSLEREVLPWLKVGLLLDYNFDHCSPNTFVTEGERQVSPEDHVPNTKAMLPGASFKLGSIDYDGHLVDGARLDYQVQGADERVLSTTSFNSQEAQLLGYKTLFGKTTAAARLGLGLSNTRRIQYYYFLGGLDRVRGFAASRFYGRNYWLANLEYRVPVVERDWLVVQAVSFHDAIGLANDRVGLDATSASSVGLGLRFIAPQIYRLVLRVDYARPLVRDDMQPVSFGIQQFF